jgi:thioredoxin 1
MSKKHLIYSAVIIILILLFSFGGKLINNENNNDMKTDKDFEQIISDSKPTVVDFYADWCAPCKIQGPIIDEFAEEMNDKVNVIKINVDSNKDLANKYGIVSIPAILIFKDGEKIWKAVGVQQKEVLKTAVSPHLK